MKITLGVLIAIVALAYSANATLLLNGDFQTASSVTTNLAAGWDGVTVDNYESAYWGNMTRSEGWAGTGAGEFAIYLHGWEGGDAGIWQRNLSNSITGGEWYTLAGSFKKEAGFAVTNSYVCKLDFFTSDNSWLATYNVDLSPIDSDTNWITCTTGLIQAPTNAAGYYVVFEAKGMVSGGCLGVDDLALTAVPEPVSAMLLGLGIAAVYAVRRKVAKTDETA